MEASGSLGSVTLSPGAGRAGETASVTTPHNLPAAPDSFVGREAETVRVRELLGAARLVTLTGPAGMGKSRLGLHVAAAVLPLFPDGAWRAELAPVADDGHVGLAIAAALGVPETGLAAHLASRRLLLILDHCEHLLPGCAEAARRLLESGAGVRILATSREPLHVPGEAIHRVQTLPGPHAIELFVARARAADPALDPGLESSPAVAELCRRVDGIPLAVELAAARVCAQPVARIARRLEHHLRRHVGDDSVAAPHDQVLRAALDWSHEQLSAPERALLRRLAVFAGGWTPESAESVCAGGELDAEVLAQVLANLAQKSLVRWQAGAQRYRMPGAVREHALERLEESGEAADTRDLHLQHFLAFASRARIELVGAAHAAGYARLDPERENILAAQRWCDEAGQPLLGLRLVSSLKTYWANRGMVAYARGVILAALETVPERGRQRGRTLFDAGQMACLMGLYGEARAQLEEGLAIAREIGDRVLAGLILQPLGLACAGAGDDTAARAHLEEALALAREQGETRRVVAAMGALAQVHRALGDHATARSLDEQGAGLVRELGDPQG